MKTFTHDDLLVAYHDDGAGLGGIDQKLGGLFAFGRGHAGGGFVDEQKLGVLGEEHADFQPLFLAM